MRKVNLFLIAALVLLISSAVASAQGVRRITFARGATRTTVTGTFSRYHQKQIFKIHVRAGQTMHIEATGSHGISIYVEGPPGSGYEQDMAADCHGQADAAPTSAGDYKLTVTQCEKVPRWRGAYRFRVSVK